MGPWQYNLAAAPDPNKWARLVAQPKVGTSIPSQPTQLQGCSGKSLVACWSACLILFLRSQLLAVFAFPVAAFHAFHADFRADSYKLEEK